MAITTSYAFRVDNTFWNAATYDDLAVTGYANGYFYGGFTPPYETTAWAVTSGVPDSGANLSGTEIALTVLANGNYVAATQDADSVIYQVRTINHAAVTAIIDTGDANTSNPDVAAAASGFVIVNEDLFLGAGSDYDIDLRYYNAAGVLTNTVLVAGGAETDRDASVAVLDNGNVAVGWVRTVGSETEVWTAVYTSSGAVVKSATLVDTDGTLNDRVQLTANAGGYAMLYRDNDNFFNQAAAAVRTFDASGNLLNSSQITDSFYYFDPEAITRLSNGLIVAAVRLGDGKSTWKLIDPATLSVLAETATTDFWASDGDSVLAAFGAGRFAAASQVITGDGFSGDGHEGQTKIREVSAQRVMTGDNLANTITALDDMSHHLLGGDGNDKLFGGLRNDDLDGGLGNDTLDGKGGDDVLRGGAGNDNYLVNSKLDVIIEEVNEGTDKVTSTAYDYTISANVENLTLGSGAVIGRGSDGANTLTGNSAANSLFGAGGKDKLDGKGGADYMEGGDGDDTYFIDNASDVVLEANAAAAVGGKDTVNVSYAGSYFLGANVENGNLTGSGQQLLFGNELANTLSSKGNTTNNHFLVGLGGKDILKGGAGMDILAGGAGSDTLTGGGGNDFFQFDVVETSANKDTIKDFSHADDEIDFYTSAFSALSAAAGSRLTSHPEMFFAGTAANTANHRIIYDQGTGNLYYDTDGSGGAAQILVAVLSNKPLLDASDIYIF